LPVPATELVCPLFIDTCFEEGQTYGLISLNPI
jgi:hypothetical protein